MKPTAIASSGSSDALARAIEASMRLETPMHSQSPHHGLWRPLADIKISPQEVAAFIDLPGIDEDTIGVTTQNGTLKVTGERDFDHDSEDAEDFIRVERIYGPYAIEIPLPADANTANMTAKYKRGVLKVRIPRHRGEGK